MSASEWRDLARSIFEEAGSDEILDATLLSTGATQTYDRTKGKFTSTPVETSLKIFPYEKVSKLTDPGLWVAGDYMVMAGTYGLNFRITGGQVTWTDPVSSDEITCDIIQVKEEDGGVSAFSYLHMRKSGG